MEEVSNVLFVFLFLLGVSLHLSPTHTDQWLLLLWEWVLERQGQDSRGGPPHGASTREKGGCSGRSPLPMKIKRDNSPNTRWRRKRKRRERRRDELCFVVFAWVWVGLSTEIVPLLFLSPLTSLSNTDIYSMGGCCW